MIRIPSTHTHTHSAGTRNSKLCHCSCCAAQMFAVFLIHPLHRLKMQSKILVTLCLGGRTFLPRHPSPAPCPGYVRSIVSWQPWRRWDFERLLDFGGGFQDRKCCFDYIGLSVKKYKHWRLTFTNPKSSNGSYSEKVLSNDVYYFHNEIVEYNSFKTSYLFYSCWLLVKYKFQFHIFMFQNNWRNIKTFPNHLAFISFS